MTGSSNPALPGTPAPPPVAGLRVLVVDDEPDVLCGLRLLATSTGAAVETASSGTEARERIRAAPPQLLLSDISMPGLTGMELLDLVQREQPQVKVVLITGFGTIETAVTALQRGAVHFITKPFDNDEILAAIRKFGRLALMEEEVRRRLAAAPATGTRTMVAEDPRMRSVVERVERVAPTAVTVLIRGESGTGKELAARAIHERSPQRDRPFLAVNTAALPDTLLESELFGHRQGAFTGADHDRKGIFEQAAGGTVFLDEIGLMSPAFQGKLLRVLQERTVIPLGTARAIPVEFRLVAATSQNLRRRIEDGQFREDLLYRLQVVTVDLPPLRERPGDILPLAAHFLAKYAPQLAEAGTPTPAFSPSALDAMKRATWPGNARQLENAVQRALVLYRGGVIHAYDLGLEDEEAPAFAPAADVPYEEAKRQAIERFQRQYVERAMARTGGNVSRAAEACGMTRAAFQRILRALRIDRTSFDPEGGMAE